MLFTFDVQSYEQERDLQIVEFRLSDFGSKHSIDNYMTFYFSFIYEGIPNPQITKIFVKDVWKEDRFQSEDRSNCAQSVTDLTKLGIELQYNWQVKHQK